MKEYDKDIIDIAKCLGQTVRLRIVRELAGTDMVVETLALKVGERPSVISHHLAVLEQSDLVFSVKEGRYKIYSLNKERLDVFLERVLFIIRKEKKNGET